MNLTDTLEILNQLGIDDSDVIVRREGQIQIPCPLAPWFHEKKSDSRPSCSLKYSEDHPTLFRCFSCNEKGKLSSLVESYATLTENSDLLKLAIDLQTSDKPTLSSRVKKLGSFMDKWVKEVNRKRRVKIHYNALDRMIPALDTEIARSYLEERQIPRNIVKEFDLKYDPMQSRLVFPVRDIEGHLVGAVGRTLNNHDIKYRNYLGFNSTDNLGGIHKVSNSHRRIILVEGFLCLLHAIKWARELECDIVCCWHGDLSQQQAETLIFLDKTVYVWYDNDITGNRGWERVQELLGGQLPIKRASLRSGRDVGSMTKDEFVKTFSQLRDSLKLGV